MADKMTRRTAIASISAMVAISPLHAQEFPARTIRIVVPYPPGGPTDALARIIANELQTEFSQTVIVDNKPGGSGAIGTRLVARAEKDGYTLVLGTDQTHVKNAFLLKDLGYDPVKDFSPILGVADLPLALVVRQDLPAQTTAAFIALAKAEPGKLNYGSSGVGSGSHLAMELFALRSGIRLTHVPFSGAGPLATEIVAGRLDGGFVTLPSVLGHIKAGNMRALAVASAARAPQLPEVQTLAEQGVKDAEADAWLALFAPAGLPDGVRGKLTEGVKRALARKESGEGIAKLGFLANIREPAAFSAYLNAELSKWQTVIKAAKIEAQ